MDTTRDPYLPLTHQEFESLRNSREPKWFKEKGLRRTIVRLAEALSLFSMPECYKKVHSILECRSEFPAAQWHNAMHDRTQTLDRTLKLIQKHGGWPNHHFVPDDSLIVLANCSLNEFMTSELEIDLRDRFGDRAVPVWKDVGDEEWTVKQLVEYIANVSEE